MIPPPPNKKISNKNKEKKQRHEWKVQGVHVSKYMYINKEINTNYMYVFNDYKIAN